MKPHELLKALMDRDHIGPLPLAKAMRKPKLQPQIDRLSKGKVAEPKRTTTEPLAEYFKIPVEAFYDVDVAIAVATELGLPLQGSLSRSTKIRPMKSGTATAKAQATPLPEAVAAAIRTIGGTLLAMNAVQRAGAAGMLERLGSHPDEWPSVSKQMARLAEDIEDVREGKAVNS